MKIFRSINIRLSGLSVIVAAFLFAENGYYIEEKVTTPPIFGLPAQTHFTKTWITDTHLRRDEGDKNQTLLIDTRKNQAWLVRHQDSTMIKMDIATFQGMALMTMMMFGVTYDTLTGEPIIPDSIFYKTGRQRHVGEWDCHEVVIHSRRPDSGDKRNHRVIMWVTTSPDRPLYASILRTMMGPMVRQYAFFFDQLERLGGYPAELHTRAMGVEVTQKLLLLEERDIADSFFQLPPGYQSEETP
ncbi:hypothetical protein JW835_01125 [bacterium]|nr:hypothetical protein [bacterium]